MYSALTSSNWLSLHGFAIVAGLLIYVVTSHVQQQRRNPSSAIGWVLFILLVPYAFLNYELMVAFESATDVMRYIAWFDLERNSARQYVSQPLGLWRDIGEGLVLWIGFQL